MGFLAELGSAIGEGAGAAGSAIGEGAATAGSALGSAASTVGSGLGSAAGTVGSGIQSGASTLANAAKDVGSKLSSGFTGSSNPGAPSNFHSDSEIPMPENKKSGFGDILKEVKSYTPGHGAPGVQMGNIQPVQTGQQPEQQSPQFQQLMDYIQKQKASGM